MHLATQPGGQHFSNRPLINAANDVLPGDKVQAYGERP